MHDNVIKVLGCGREALTLNGDPQGEKLYLVSELAENGDLFNLVMHEQGGGLDEKHCRKLFGSITQGVSYLHGVGVAHRDLKLDNIFLAANNQPKIADFGLMKVFGTYDEWLFRTYVGTAAYMAPEIKKD